MKTKQAVVQRMINLTMTKETLKATWKMRTYKMLGKRKRIETNSDGSRELMQKAITILESRQKTDKTDDQFDNYGKYIACQLREMPERAREYVEIKIQETIYQVKTYVNNGQQPPQPFQPANFHLPATPPAMFKAKFTHAKTGTTTLTQFPGNLKFINNNKL